jgi:hypothetical protein
MRIAKIWDVARETCASGVIVVQTEIMRERERERERWREMEREMERERVETR